MIHNLHYNFLLGCMKNHVVRGRVLNVGLGAGASARILLDSRRVDFVVTLERDEAVIDAYRAIYPADEFNEWKRHEIKWQDARASLTVGPAFFDWIYFDIFRNHTPEEMAECRAVVENLASYLKPDGALTLEYLADTLEEGKFRRWMDESWTTEEVRPGLTETGTARAQPMRIYRPRTTAA